MNFFINILVVSFVKIIDNILSTGKAILIQRNKAVLAGIFVAVSQIIFYKLINVAQNGKYMIYVISVASGVGTYLAIFISNKFCFLTTYRAIYWSIAS